MQKNKYLDELGLNIKDYGTNRINEDNTERSKRWEEQRQLYGFDDRETWSLDVYFAEWLYSHLMMYKESAGEVINLKFYKFTWDNKEITQLEAIDMLIDAAKDYILAESKYMKNVITSEMVKLIFEEFYKLMPLWGMILPHMWW
jgi:hypothetical protein